jgi:hypothetical protein
MMLLTLLTIPTVLTGMGTNVTYYNDTNNVYSRATHEGANERVKYLGKYNSGADPALPFLFIITTLHPCTIARN